MSKPKTVTPQRGTDAWSCAKTQGMISQIWEMAWALGLEGLFLLVVMKNEKLSIIFFKKNGISGSLNFVKKSRKLQVLQTWCVVKHVVWFCKGNPIGNPWHVLMSGVCGFSVGIGSCTSLRHTCQT